LPHCSHRNQFETFNAKQTVVQEFPNAANRHLNHRVEAIFGKQPPQRNAPADIDPRETRQPTGDALDAL
jgi:hypothetical protein